MRRSWVSMDQELTGTGSGCQFVGYGRTFGTERGIVPYEDPGVGVDQELDQDMKETGSGLDRNWIMTSHFVSYGRTFGSDLYQAKTFQETRK